MSGISLTVGKNGVNRHDDVMTVQTLLNDNMSCLFPLKPLRIDGHVGTRTLEAIELFQKRVAHPPKIDVRVDPRGPTFKALRNCCCAQPQENFPYDDDTFQLVKRLAILIKTNSAKFGVPPIAVAGSIADEYNTRRGMRMVGDWLQDDILLNYMPNFAIQIDAYIGFNTKLLNATKHDLGLGNVKLETAKSIYDQYKATFDRKNMDYADLVDYLRSDAGTAHVAALVIKKAMHDMAPYLKGVSQEKAEGIYVTYYKQGPTYLARFRNSLAANPSGHIQPGEGCRVILQRERFEAALGL